MMEHYLDGRFFKQVKGHVNLLKTLQQFSDSITVVKDQASRYVFGTLRFAQLCRQKEPKEILGHTDEDFFPKYLCDQYRDEDREVMAGTTIYNKKWLVPEQHGVISWCLSSKFPIQGTNNQIIGLCCRLKMVRIAEGQIDPRLTKVIQYIGSHYDEKLDQQTLAQMCHLSTGQFSRNFKKTFNCTPNDYITKTRINAACHDLETSDLSVTEIALRNGFFDCSHFGKQFHAMMGVSPGTHRKKWKQ